MSPEKRACRVACRCGGIFSYEEDWDAHRDRAWEAAWDAIRANHDWDSEYTVDDLDDDHGPVDLAERFWLEGRERQIGWTWKNHVFRAGPYQVRRVALCGGSWGPTDIHDRRYLPAAKLLFDDDTCMNCHSLATTGKWPPTGFRNKNRRPT